MDKQAEIDLSGCEVKQLAVPCKCAGPKQTVIVVLQRGIDPRFWVGTCNKCGKKHCEGPTEAQN